MSKIAVTITEAAELVPASVSTIRRAIRATDPQTFPPPLKAKRDSKGRLAIKVRDLEDWFDSWDPA